MIPKSHIAKVKAHNEGAIYQESTDLFKERANNAPIVGPAMKPTEKATPTSAIPNARVLTLETSVITDMQRDMFPLLMPPTNRASTKSAKLLEKAHRRYDNAIPLCKIIINKINCP